MFIPDPIFTIPDPGLTTSRIPDPYLQQRTGSGFFFIPDPGIKKHRIPDPDSQHWWIGIVLPYPGINF
jgi:hypothetical protein